MRSDLAQELIGVELLIQFIFTILLLSGGGIWISNLTQQNKKLRNLVRHAQREQQAVFTLIDKVGEKITTKLDLEETLNIIAEYIVDATHAESGAVFIVNEDDNTLQARVVLGPFPPLHETNEYIMTTPKNLAEKIKRDKIRIGEGLVGLVAERGEPLLVTDAASDPLVPRHATMLNDIHSIILCPLRARGQMLGVFVVVNKLGDAIFDKNDLTLLQAMADQAAVTTDLVRLYDMLAEQQKLEQELQIAHEFQQMLLPREFPKLDGFEIYAMSEAAKDVGGDYYDCFQIDAEHWGLVVADVSGKGVPGALIMAMVRSVLRAESRNSLSPKQTLAMVNERITADTKDNVFITMIYGVLNVNDATFNFVRAGHEPLLILNERTEAIDALAPSGLALGLIAGEMFDYNEECQVTLTPGQTALLYTDGVIEAMDRLNQEYGHERLYARLKSGRKATAEEIVQRVVDDIHQFTLGIPQHDDITMLVLRMMESDTTQAAPEALSPVTEASGLIEKARFAKCETEEAAR